MLECNKDRTKIEGKDTGNKGGGYELKGPFARLQTRC